MLKAQNWASHCSKLCYYVVNKVVNFSVVCCYDIIIPVTPVVNHYSLLFLIPCTYRTLHTVSIKTCDVRLRVKSASYAKITYIKYIWVDKIGKLK